MASSKVVKETKSLADQYLNSKTEVKAKIRLGVTGMLSELKKLKLNAMSKYLTINLAEIAYIKDADAVELVDLIMERQDYDLKIAIGAELKITKIGKKSIGRLLIYLKRLINRAEQNETNQHNRANDLREDISNLMLGKAEVAVCPICEGTGNVYDDNDKLIICWNCDGDKKVITGKTI